MKTGIIAVIVAILVIGGGAFLLTKNKKSNSTTANSSQNTSSSTPASNATDNSNAANSNSTDAVTITYSDSGFSPSSVTVKSGGKVTVTNTSSHDLQFDSDPHPVHTDDADLNAGMVAPGKSISFTVSKKGSFGYHNHLNAGETGTIIIE